MLKIFEERSENILDTEAKLRFANTSKNKTQKELYKVK